MGELDRYEIRLQGQLDGSWSDWFEGFTLTTGNGGTTTLTGAVVDQAALHGLLRRVGDLGVTLISVNAVDTTQKIETPSSPTLGRTQP